MTTILALSLRAHHFTLDDPGSLEHNNWCEFLRAIWDQPGIFDVYFGKDVNSPTRVELFLSTCFACLIGLAKYVMVFADDDQHGTTCLLLKILPRPSSLSLSRASKCPKRIFSATSPHYLPPLPNDQTCSLPQLI